MAKLMATLLSLRMDRPWAGPRFYTYKAAVSFRIYQLPIYIGGYYSQSSN